MKVKNGLVLKHEGQESICNLVFKCHILVIFVMDRELSKGCGFVKHLFTSRGPGLYVASTVHHWVLSLSFLWGSKSIPVNEMIEYNRVKYMIFE